MLRCFKRHPGEGTLDCLLGDYCGNIESSYHDFCFSVCTVLATLLGLWIIRSS